MSNNILRDENRDLVVKLNVLYEDYCDIICHATGGTLTDASRPVDEIKLYIDDYVNSFTEGLDE